MAGNIGLSLARAAVGDWMWIKRPMSSFFIMLTILGVAAGAAMYVLGPPLNRVIAKHE